MTQTSEDRTPLAYTSPGYLAGVCPSGEAIIVAHEQQGRTGYLLYWRGQRYDRFGQQKLEEVFGITPREKRSGGQIGYPSEPVIRALWRYLVDRYNRGDPGIRYSRVPLRVTA